MTSFAFITRHDLRRLSGAPVYPFEIDPALLEYFGGVEREDEGRDTGWWISLWERCSIEGGLKRWGITARVIEATEDSALFQVALPVWPRVIDAHFTPSTFRRSSTPTHYPFDERFPDRPGIADAPDTVLFNVPLPHKRVTERQGLVILRDIVMRALAHELDESFSVDSKLLSDPHEVG